MGTNEENIMWVEQISVFLENKTGRQVASIPPDEFRRFLDTVSPDEFAAETDEET